MLRDIILYMCIALPSLAVIMALPLIVGVEPTPDFLLMVILYIAGGAWIVFHWYGAKPNHAPGEASFATAFRNIWWVLLWPWFVWHKWND